MTANDFCPSGRRITLLLSLAGLLSAVCSTFLAALGAGYILAGLAFGGAMTISLMKFRILDNRQGFRLLAVAIIAYILSFLVAFYVQLHLPVPEVETWSMGHGEAISPMSFFAGGLVGGFLFFGQVLYFLRPNIPAGSLTVNALSLSLLAGVMGVVGWALGPSLGTTVSRIFYAAGFPGTVQVPADPLYGYRTPAVEYSLYLVWQTGMATVLGIMVCRYRVLPGVKKMEQP